MNEALAPIVDGVIAFTLSEALALLAWRRWNGGGVAPRDFLLNMVSGLCLMLALRGVLRQAGGAWVMLCLLAAGVSHLADLQARWRRRPAASLASAGVQQPGTGALS